MAQYYITRYRRVEVSVLACKISAEEDLLCLQDIFSADHGANPSTFTAIVRGTHRDCQEACTYQQINKSATTYSPRRFSHKKLNPKQHFEHKQWLRVCVYSGLKTNNAPRRGRGNIAQEFYLHKRLAMHKAQVANCKFFYHNMNPSSEAYLEEWLCFS